MQALFHKRFEKQFAKLPRRVQEKFQERFELFYENPNDAELNNHTLKDKFTGHHSINVTSDIRAIYQIVDEDICLFTSIGSHSELYS